MAKCEWPNIKSVVAATVAASLLMLLSGSAYRVLAARLTTPNDTSPIDPAAMERFPVQIGDWTGAESPIDDAVVRATATDAHISRHYSRHNGMESVYLYVACGVKARDLMPHRPEVCFTGNGWTLVDRRSVELSLNGGTRLPCNLMRFSRGVIGTKAVCVLDYYLVDGQYCPDVSLLRSKAWRGLGAVQYVAQVEVVAAVTAGVTADSAAKLISAFAVDSASAIAQLFENPEQDERSDGSREAPKGD